MFGVGLPTAVQVRFAKSLSFNHLSPRITVITGGAGGAINRMEGTFYNLRKKLVRGYKKKHLLDTLLKYLMKK